MKFHHENHTDSRLLPFDTFKTMIWDYYQHNRRDFSWRATDNPYHIVVSEIMLQQTQTYRVAPKYELFIKAFPDFTTLAQAPLQNLLAAWHGLGYNRRALALQKTAQKVVQEYNGLLPNDPETLVTFPGIGKATAASICAFAFNKPTIFIETNIRAVYIHTFFPHRDDVHDKEILPLVQATVDHSNAREWYYALMDYGVMLKKKYKNPSRKSSHHTQQSAFEGSDRQIRGMILKILIERQVITIHELWSLIDRDPSRVQTILNDLVNEKFIVQKGSIYTFAS